MSSPANVTVLGIGNMGSALAQAWLRGGHAVTAWNRTAERQHVKNVVATGAFFEPSLLAAIQRSDFILICLMGYDSVRAVLSTLPEGSLRGKTIFNVTNGTPRDAREIAPWFKHPSRGAARYFDAAIMAPPAMVGGPHSFHVVSGEDEASFNEHVAAVIAPTGRGQYEGVDVGAASLFESATLASMYAMFGGALLGMALYKRTGGEDSKLAPTVQGKFVPFLANIAPYIGQLAESWDKKDWDNSDASGIGMVLDGLKTIQRTCHEEGVDGGGLDHLCQLLEKGQDKHGFDGNIASAGPFLLK